MEPLLCGGGLKSAGATGAKAGSLWGIVEQPPELNHEVFGKLKPVLSRRQKILKPESRVEQCKTLGIPSVEGVNGKYLELCLTCKSLLQQYLL